MQDDPLRGFKCYFCGERFDLEAYTIASWQDCPKCSSSYQVACDAHTGMPILEDGQLNPSVRPSSLGMQLMLQQDEAD